MSAGLDRTATDRRESPVSCATQYEIWVIRKRYESGSESAHALYRAGSTWLASYRGRGPEPMMWHPVCGSGSQARIGFDPAAQLIPQIRNCASFLCICYHFATWHISFSRILPLVANLCRERDGRLARRGCAPCEAPESSSYTMHATMCCTACRLPVLT